MKADTQPANRKYCDSPAVAGFVLKNPRRELPAFRGDWADEELGLLDEFIDENEPDDPTDHIRLLEAMGARRVGEPIAAYGVEWQTLQDPEGHEFCVVAHGRLVLPSDG